MICHDPSTGRDLGLMPSTRDQPCGKDMGAPSSTHFSQSPFGMGSRVDGRYGSEAWNLPPGTLREESKDPGLKRFLSGWELERAVLVLRLQCERAD